MSRPVDTAPAVALLREIVREAQHEANRWQGGSSYDQAIERRDAAVVALAALDAP